MPQCPRDHHILEVRPALLLASSRCPQCAGLWLPATTVNGRIGWVARPHPVSVHGLPPRCPEDRAPLLAVFHHGVEVDLCSSCGGVWLDHGELEQILRERRIELKSAVQDLGQEAAANPQAIIDLADLGSDALSAVLDFIADALSGL